MKIRKAFSNEMDKVRELFREYEKELGLDLCFQNFAKELAELPGIYSEPQGCILLMTDKEEYAGIIALKPLEEGICEMKRLYLRPEYRKNGNGEKLARALLKEAKKKKFLIMKLDTLERLKPAMKLYEKLGFLTTDAYNYNPDNTVKYFQKLLN